MNGGDVRRLRKKLNVDPFALAAFLGVHVSTVYRWEASNSDVSIDPIQRELFTAIIKWATVSPRPSRSRYARIGKTIRDGLIEGGTLVALYRVLSLVLGEI